MNADAQAAVGMAAARPMRLPARIWAVLALLFSIGVLNYFDRQTMSILKSTLKGALGFDDEAYSLLIFAFMLPYIVMYVVSGRLIDRFGTRMSMTAFIGFWSLANALSGLSHSFGHLAASRALLGAAEPGAFPVTQRAILNWVPIERRAFAMSLMTPAGSLGAVLAPPLVALLASTSGWRGAFIVPGLLGFAIALAWWRLDRGAPAEAKVEQEPPVPMRELLADRRLWGIIAARTISDPVWFFYLFWIPGFLQERLGFTLAELGLVAGIPYGFAVIACLFFGRFVDSRVARGRHPVDVQLRIFALTAALMPLGALVTVVPNAALALAIITVVTAVCQSWFLGTGVLLAGLFPARVNASAMGVIGAFGASTGLLLNLFAGSVIGNFGYAAVFVGTAALHPIAAAILWLVIGRSRRVAAGG